MASSIAQPAPRLKRTQYWLLALFLVTIVLRLILVSRGGQFFFGDEGRQERGVALYREMLAGNFSAVGTALARPEHIGFTFIGVGITALQHATAQFTLWHDWQHPENVIFSYALGAGWLAMFSVLNIWFVYRIARSAGADETEAGWAALLMACSNTGFYYARHFLPYDAALSCALAAVWVGLNGRRSFVCGLFAGAAYHCYNGYWYLVPVVVVLHLGWQASGAFRPRLSRFIIVSAGAVLALTVPIAVGVAIAGRSYWETMVGFSGTVMQGSYREGWSLPAEYFWCSEGVLAVAVCLAIVAAVNRARQSTSSIDRRMLLWLAAAVMSYAWLVLFSVGFEKFVVYGRSLKPLVPFICLAGGWAAKQLLSQQKRLAPLMVVACCLAASMNFLPHFGIIFPAEVEHRVLRDTGMPKHSLSIAGSIYVPLALPVNRPDLVLVNAQMLYPVRNVIGYPHGTVIFNLSHPLSYRPYQYEGHNPRERALLRENDINIRLIRADNPAALPDNLPVKERFTLSDKSNGRAR